MASLSRRLTRHLSWKRPAEAVPVSEGVLLSQRLEQAANAAHAHAARLGRTVPPKPDPLGYLEYLRQMRRGYSPSDGPSELMRLVDDIAKFETEELARRKAASEQAAAGKN